MTLLFGFPNTTFLLERAIVPIEEIISLIKFDVLFTTAHFHYNKVKSTFRRM
jgi:hypothetical protein